MGPFHCGLAERTQRGKTEEPARGWYIVSGGVKLPNLTFHRPYYAWRMLTTVKANVKNLIEDVSARRFRATVLRCSVPNNFSQ